MTGKPRALATAPAHPDVEIIDVEVGFARHLSVEVVRFRHRLFAGGWSGERVFDVVRRGGAAAVLLYDPDEDSVVLVEQFRIAALCGGRSPWQVEAVAGLIDKDESPEEVARREATEEANLDPIGPLVPIQTMLPACGSYDEAVHLFCGRVDCRSAGGIYGLSAEQEDIRIVVKTIPEIEAMLDEGRIDSAHTLISLYWLLRHRDRLRGVWGLTPAAAS
ncbi:MAG TPA: NUDIX domain-containing protein [Stellaceae bacterium]|nr:NUDIX domain-containing protein [Stellaceae bacterium]